MIKVVIKNTKFNTLNTKVNNLENKILDKSTLIPINQYNSDKLNLKKKVKNIQNKIASVSNLVTNSVLNTKIGQVESKIHIVTNLVTPLLIQKLKKLRIKSLLLLIQSKRQIMMQKYCIEGKYFTN